MKIKTISIIALGAAAVIAAIIAGCSTRGGSTNLPPMYRTGDLRIGVRVQPDPPKEGENTFKIYVQDASGKPVTDAQVAFKVDMPTMSMGGGEVQAQGIGQGVYSGKASMGMQGTWHMTVTVTRGNAEPGGMGFDLAPGKKGVVGEGELVTEGNRQEAVASNQSAQGGKALYHCPMHPNYTSDRPGDCPICGMKLVKSEPASPAQSMVTGAVTVTPEMQRLIGVRTDTVGLRMMGKEIRAVGKVTYDEQKLASVNTKVGGWIEKLYVDYTGKAVAKGEPLFTIYSPDLVTAQEEYLTALKAGGDLAQTAKDRLKLWDISDAQIKEIARSGQSQKTLTIAAPADGFVVAKSVLAGDYVRPGQELYKIASIATVWVEAQVYEYELPYVKVGQAARVSLSYDLGETFTGRVSYIYPYLDPQTRTATVRVALANPGHKLLPDMYANVMLTKELGEKLAVPEEAIMDTGERQLAFLALPGGRFEPKDVKVGARSGGYYEVLSGLEEGDVVVTSANFLIDAESRLKSAMNGM
jgi:Cu(I)/Ag(I) efflux system membrane fusion protein